MPGKQAKERNRAVLRIASLLLILYTTIETSHQMQTPWSQRAPKNLKFVVLTAKVYIIPPLVTWCSIVKAERRFLRTATDASTVYERATTTVSVWARKIEGTARNAIINPCDQVHTKVNVSMANESAGSEKSSTTTSATSTTINANIQQPKTVLLQTARAVVLDETGKISTPVRILFDTGSQRTYVTENLQPKLKSVQHERLNLNTFGSSLQISKLRLCSFATQTTWLS